MTNAVEPQMNTDVHGWFVENELRRDLLSRGQPFLGHLCSSVFIRGSAVTTVEDNET
jgi:hypothetical protein